MHHFNYQEENTCNKHYLRLFLERGKVTVTNGVKSGEEVEIPINILTSIYTGYKDICYYKREIILKSEVIYEILKVLFPLENPYIWDLEQSDELQ